MTDDYKKASFITEPNHKGDRLAFAFHTGLQNPRMNISIIGGDGKTQSFGFDYLCLKGKKTDFDRLVDYLIDCQKIDQKQQEVIA